MKLSLWMIHRKQTAAFGIVGWMLAIAPLWLMLAIANNSVYAQTSDDVSNSSAAAAASSPADWTQFLRDNMQRWNPYETTLGVNNVRGLQLKWKNSVSMPEGGGDYSASSPTVANRVVYFGSRNNNVYALNASTGAKLWSFDTGGWVESSPAVVNGVVYIGSINRNVYALNASTGAKLWSFPAGGGTSSPAVANGVVYFVDSEDGNVYALNANTGTKLWSFPARAYSSPAVANGVVYVGSSDGTVYALNASTGAKVWSNKAGYSVDALAVANGVVYVASGDLYALNASTGATLWSYYNAGRSTPAVANGIVYFNGGLGNNVNALNASTGARLWSFMPPDDLFSSPAVANGVVYVTSNSTTYALNARTGARLWSYFIGRFSSYSSPTIVDGVLYVRSGDYRASSGNTYAFALGSADLFLRIWPSTTTVHQGDLLTYAFPVWNLGPDNAVHEVLNTQVPAGTTFDYIRISGTPGLGTCTHPPYGGTGQIVCYENAAMAPNTTWTVRLTVKVTAPSGTMITANAATMAESPDPNMSNNTDTVSLTVQ